MGTKNNPKNRGAVIKHKTLDGKKIEPVLYVGGKARYMAAKYSGTTEIIIDKTSGIVMQWDKIIGDPT
jgi:hypothetical protein